MRTLKIIGKIISNALLVCVVVFAAVIVLPKLIGWQSFVVLSGSMEPTYHVGSLIYVKPVSPQEVRAGDPITYHMPDETTVVTHRAVRIDTQKQCFYTKGDANNTEDGSATPFSRLIGKPMFSIPALGFAISFINTKQGFILAVTGIVCLLILAFLPDLLKKIKVKSESEMSEQPKGG